jgi:hypothetical protein
MLLAQVPGRQPQQDRDRLTGLAALQQLEGEQHDQHGLAGAGLAEHDQPALWQGQELVGDLAQVAVQAQLHHPAGERGAGDGLGGGGDRAGSLGPGQPQRRGPAQGPQPGLSLPLGLDIRCEFVGGPVRPDSVRDRRRLGGRFGGANQSQDRQRQAGQADEHARDAGGLVVALED